MTSSLSSLAQSPLAAMQLSPCSLQRWRDALVEQGLKLADLSALPRQALRGANVEPLLSGKGLTLPSHINQLAVNDDGSQVLRLGLYEYWQLAATGGELVDSAALAGEGVYPLPCQDSHALFALAGGDAITCMAKVCGVDLRDAAFPSGSIAQTSVAKVNASVVKTELDGQQFLYILCSQASAQYLWESLVDAMTEFGGEVLGTLPYADVA